jgi:hypothetical protein
VHVGLDGGTEHRALPRQRRGEAPSGEVAHVTAVLHAHSGRHEGGLDAGWVVSQSIKGAGFTVDIGMALHCHPKAQGSYHALLVVDLRDLAPFGVQNEASFTAARGNISLAPRIATHTLHEAHI